MADTAKHNLKINGKYYPPGSVLPDLTEFERSRLIELGAIVAGPRAAKEAPVTAPSQSAPPSPPSAVSGNPPAPVTSAGTAADGAKHNPGGTAAKTGKGGARRTSNAPAPGRRARAGK